MKMSARFQVSILSLLFLAGCMPDLTVTSLDVEWNAANKKAVARVENIGDRDAGPFMVYFNAEEDPVSANHRPQVSHSVSGLADGDEIELEADFAPLAHPDNANLGHVRKIVVLVDPTVMVSEKNENNNSKEKPLP